MAGKPAIITHQVHKRGNMKANLYIQGEICTGNLLYSDKKTYINVCHVFEILDGRFKGEKIAIFEGVFDAVSSLVLIPDLSAISLQGQARELDLANRYLEQEVYFGADNDEPGQRLFEKVKAEFEKKGSTIHRYPIDYTGYKDLNDYLKGQL